MSFPKDPYDVLNLPRQPPPTHTDVKKAFRQLALQYHPDLNTTPEAAKKYEQIRLAADRLLNKSTHTPIQAARHSWAAHYNVTRHPRFPLYFCGASLVAGCFIFAGAIHIHQDLYTSNIHQEAEKRRQNPTERQRQIMEMLQEQQQQASHWQDKHKQQEPP
ncbi:hypothetical protein WJX73_010338 [Symbiochloris irregularis]|uniref:J domain-containing protein n=1 Tax=Symbiochloris irregularis TaxID=706552 RepID=A0AAW1Q2U9_9CHLO